MAVEPVLRMKGISKSYYGTKVLDSVNLSIMPGEVHGIVGENGAGKSTLMNILFGMNVIHSTGGFEGSIEIAGQPVQIKSPLQAMALGIGMVHQEFMLLPNYSVTENIKLNREVLKPNLASRIFGPRLQSLDYDKMYADARKALKRLNIDIDEYATIAGLPVGYMQFTEIARELDKEHLRILVFDEPTAVLAESEAAHLLEAIKEIAAAGIAVLFITHRLNEIMEVCDNITVLRDGRHVVTKASKDTNVIELAELMVGRSMEFAGRKQHYSHKGRPILEIKQLTVDMPGERVRGVDLTAYEGEILGIGGLAGQGKIGIANGIMGLFPAAGDVKVAGTPLPLNNPSASIAAGLAFVSEDRRGVGLLLNSSIEVNIASGAMFGKKEFIKTWGPFSQVDQAAVRENAQKLIGELDIRCTGPRQLVRQLSGGNQQKVCIARALTMNPKILLVSEPTRGIDVGAKQLVLDTLRRLNEELGMTIVVTSSELAELRSICSRIAIITDGRVAGILKPDDSDVNFGLLMAGQPISKGA
ncbi:MAG TPA: sugar ABC transporter ATP-binding protein [Firmicutes bacterium]|nr:MAG: sugar ABC transporter ATP-binding protein [Peptococcaceae bacterium 1109]HHT72796.1 sugar ABC transporter ATP-binding protein [Bacillota bacterium]